jgi:hypothetical protein
MGQFHVAAQGQFLTADDNEFYRVAFRKRIYRTIDELQVDLDVWVIEYTASALTRVGGATAKPRCRP